ncbi:alcohol dehydrogenase catalytic domain-containing protein [Falsibacillus pallidus]|uniref:Alcohol dehydrogenase n=1 Tax=Falsibacillus pallidus TaxID=493781 RepID=A0A370FY91_9BACI|nr:zinc-binding alcohol dehydrogenase [Falsibacillus pallidus]RDI36438.1 alcohol dehydrogenase [Falsibacillus pallidus]
MEHDSLVLVGKKDLRWMTKSLDELNDDEMLVRTIAGAVSIGAELPQYMETDLTETAPVYPKETGYENYGEVIRVGNEVSSFKAGDRVVASFGHKDYGIVKECKAISVPKDIHYSDALLAILSCDAAKGVLKLNPKPTDKVLVSGMGTMGLLTVFFLKEYSKVQHIDVLDPDLTRVGLAKRLGANRIYHDSTECTDGDYNFGIECSGYNEAFQTLQESVQTHGEICILSDGNKQKFELHPPFYEKELKIVGSSDGWNYHKHAEWYFNRVKEGNLSVSKLFELEIDKQELIKCFRELSDGKINPVKVLVKY